MLLGYYIVIRGSSGIRIVCVCVCYIVVGVYVLVIGVELMFKKDCSLKRVW